MFSKRMICYHEDFRLELVLDLVYLEILKNRKLEKG